MESIVISLTFSSSFNERKIVQNVRRRRVDKLGLDHTEHLVLFIFKSRLIWFSCDTCRTLDHLYTITDFRQSVFWIDSSIVWCSMWRTTNSVQIFCIVTGHCKSLFVANLYSMFVCLCVLVRITLGALVTVVVVIAVITMNVQSRFELSLFFYVFFWPIDVILVWL